jgi:cytochrome b561
LGLIAFRIFWRLTHPAPALIKTMKAWEKKLAECNASFLIPHHGIGYLYQAQAHGALQ